MPDTPQPFEWRPIETQPDVGEYLVYVPSERTKMQVCRSGLNANGRPLRVIGGHFSFDVAAPTHWCPLPPPPVGA